MSLNFRSLNLSGCYGMDRSLSHRGLIIGQNTYTMTKMIGRTRRESINKSGDWTGEKG